MPQREEVAGVEAPARSYPRTTPAHAELMAAGWRERVADNTFDADAIALARKARSRLAAEFPGERLVIPAGSSKIRSNDVTYLFRPHSAFAYLTGLGSRSDSDSVLVIDVDDDGSPVAELFVRPSTGPGTDAFYLDAMGGEYWTGPRPSATELEDGLWISVHPLTELKDYFADDSKKTRVLRGVSTHADTLFPASEISEGDDDARFATRVDELRLIKEPWEIEQLEKAVAVTALGFSDVVRALPRAVEVARGERVVETTFLSRARTDANDIGYGSTAAAGNNATTLHWDVCDGPVLSDDLVLLDAGAEMESLYTADITRTMPASGVFSPIQRQIYQAVLDATDAGIAAAVVGRPFNAPHDAAVTVLAERLAEWGILPVSPEESLSDEGQQHRRWMPHATSHYLGLDVHDCAASRPEQYRQGFIEAGMVFTVEPGLYFNENDELVPPEFRGIGIRIEDDILATINGPVNLSAAIPRTVEDIESWMAPLLEQGRTILSLATQ